MSETAKAEIDDQSKFLKLGKEVRKSQEIEELRKEIQTAFKKIRKACLKFNEQALSFIVLNIDSTDNRLDKLIGNEDSEDDNLLSKSATK